MNEKAHILFSYCTTTPPSECGEGGLVKRLSDALQVLGYSTFQVTEASGTDLWQKKLVKCGVVIPVMSQSFFKDSDCQHQIHLSNKHKKLIVPVMAEPFTRRSFLREAETILQGLEAVPDHGRPASPRAPTWVIAWPRALTIDCAAQTISVANWQQHAEAKDCGCAEAKWKTNKSRYKEAQSSESRVQEKISAGDVLLLGRFGR